MFFQNEPSYSFYLVELLCPPGPLKILLSANQIPQVFSSPGYTFPFSLIVHQIYGFKMIDHNGHCPLNTILTKIISLGIQNQERAHIYILNLIYVTNFSSIQFTSMDVINIKFISDNDNILLATCSVNCQVLSFFDTNSYQFLWFFTTLVQFLFICIFVYLLIHLFCQNIGHYLCLSLISFY